MIQRRIDSGLFATLGAELAQASRLGERGLFQRATAALEKLEQIRSPQEADAVVVELVFELQSHVGAEAACPPAIWLGEAECS